MAPRGQAGQAGAAIGRARARPRVDARARAGVGAHARAVGLAAVLAACSAPPLLPDLSLAEDHERAGAIEPALAAYRAAQHSCRDQRVARRRRETCAEAWLGEARLLEREGRTAAAIAVYAAIPAALDNDPPPSAEAAFKAGALALAAGADVAAYGWLWRTVSDWPDEPFAGDAVALLLRDGRGRNAQQLIDSFVALADALEGTAVSDNLDLALADLAEHESADPARALTWLDLVPALVPPSPLRDEAWWHGARLARGLGDGPGAARRLRALVATREVALGTGSYFSVWLDDAQLELGRVLRDDVGDLDGASAAFRRLPDDYPASILRDDALFELALTRERAGDVRGACAALARLTADWPDSKYRLGRAQERETALGCGISEPR